MVERSHLCNGVMNNRRWFLKLFDTFSQVHLNKAFDGLQLSLVQQYMDGLQLTLNMEVRHCNLILVREYKLAHKHTISTEVLKEISFNEEFCCSFLLEHNAWFAYDPSSPSPSFLVS